MGLDMHLNARKYLSAWNENDKPKVNEVLAALDLTEPDMIEFGTISIDVPVKSWRKANQIHRWFVSNIQYGEDNCGTYYASRERLAELILDCDEVLSANMSDVSSRILPTEPGPFYGSYEYDEWYYQELRDTRDSLKALLDNPKFNDYDFYYSSSW